MMESKVTMLEEIMEHFCRVVNKFSRFEKVPMNFGIEENLFPSEIHTIEAIGKNPGINMTELSQKLGITKGAVSQMMAKLEKKNFVEKAKSPNNDKEIRLELTKKGWKAFDGHENFHREMYLDFLRYTEKISNNDLKRFKEILGKIESHLDLYSGILI